MSHNSIDTTAQNVRIERTMIQVLQAHWPPEVCADLFDAAQVLLKQNVNHDPRVVQDGETVIELSWRFIPGDCYEPTGYKASTSDARIALRCAQVLFDVRSLVQRRAGEAIRQLQGLSFRVASPAGAVEVALKWDRLCGFIMEINRADNGHIVYSRYLDPALNPGPGRQCVEPTLDYYVCKARELGITLPDDKVDIIRRRSQLDV